MSALSDLQAQVAAAVAAHNAAIALISDLHAKLSAVAPSDDADVEAATATLATSTAALQAAVAPAPVAPSADPAPAAPTA